MKLASKSGWIALAATVAALFVPALSGCKKQNEPANPPKPNAAEMKARATAEPSALAAVSKDIRILYVGHPGTDREKDFVGFLEKYFSVVQTGNLETFKEADTQDFDVTLLDWDRSETIRPGPFPKVSNGFCRPVITLGIRGAAICLDWHLKTAHW